MTLKVGGTGSAIGFMKRLAQEYCTHHPEITIEVLPSLGSSGGILALQSGAIDLAVASRPLKVIEKRDVQDLMLGTSPFVFGVHPSTSTEDITISQLIDIYLGTQTTWSDGIPIRRILRPVNDTDWLLLQAISPEVAQALEVASQTEGLYLAVTDTDTAAYLERVTGSFAPITLTMILAEQRQVKVLSFMGIDPADPKVAKRYPLHKTYRLIVRKETSTEVTDFLKFIFSDRGKQILNEVGLESSNEK
jgi:phosphate transport system substrate-binding protein